MDQQVLQECRDALNNLIKQQQLSDDHSDAAPVDPFKALPASAQEYLMKHLKSAPPFPLDPGVMRRNFDPRTIPPLGTQSLIDAIKEGNMQPHEQSMAAPPPAAVPSQGPVSIPIHFIVGPPEKDSDADTDALEGQLGALKIESKPAPWSPKTAAKSTEPTTTPAKRARNAYMIFAAEMRPKVKQEHPDMPFGQIGALLGQMWHNLDPAQVARYKQLAEEEKAALGK